MNNKIYYTKPSITDKEVEYATDAARNGWGEKCYEYIKHFEELFCEHLQVKHAIATSSCTGALHMGLSALGIGPDDEVILADTNWIASVAPVIHLGATPILVDILPDTWCLDPRLVEQAITSKTKAIIAVHLYGNLCEMNELLAIGEKYGIPVIEDAAEAIGSVYYGKKAGSIGKFGTFSFHGTKTITTGEGGMFVTNDSDLYEQVLTLSNHGRAREQSKQFWADVVGFKYKMSNIQAAIGCAQLERIDELISEKKTIFNSYKDKLSDLPLQMNPEKSGTTNGYWMPTIVVDENYSFNVEECLSIFKNKNIDSRVFFWPLSKQPPLRQKISLPISHSIYKRAFNLPSPFGIDDIALDMICDFFKTYLLSCKFS